MPKPVTASNKALIVNFKDSMAVPKDDYAVRVANCEVKESKAGKPYLNWELEIEAGPHAGRKLYHTTSLQPQALFSLRAMLEALGIKVQEEMEIQPRMYKGMVLGVTVDHEDYQGKTQARVTEVFSLEHAPVEDDGGEDDEYLEDDEEEAEEVDEEEEDNEEEEEEQEEEEETPPPTSEAKKTAKKTAKK